MTDFTAGDEFRVTKEKISIDGEELPVESVLIDSIKSGQDIQIIYLGDGPNLPTTESVSASDISQALGDWLEKY